LRGGGRSVSVCGSPLEGGAGALLQNKSSHYNFELSYIVVNKNYIMLQGIDKE